MRSRRKTSDRSKRNMKDKRKVARNRKEEEVEQRGKISKRLCKGRIELKFKRHRKGYEL